MSGIVPEQGRLDFAEFIAQADNDSRTTGLFLLLVAPRKDGFAREAVLTVGDLPVEPVLKRVIELSLIKLSAHNNREREIPPEVLQ